MNEYIATLGPACARAETLAAMKGGIGSASRVVRLDKKDYTIGALVMSNFGGFGYLRIDGDPVGRRIEDAQNQCKADKGSIIMRERNSERAALICRSCSSFDCSASCRSRSASCWS